MFRSVNVYGSKYSFRESERKWERRVYVEVYRLDFVERISMREDQKAAAIDGA